MINDSLRAADHHAIAAFQSPYAAGGADVEIGDEFGFQRLRAPDVVLVKCVAAIDQNIPRAQ